MRKVMATAAMLGGFGVRSSTMGLTPDVMDRLPAETLLDERALPLFQVFELDLIDATSPKYGATWFFKRPRYRRF